MFLVVTITLNHYHHQMDQTVISTCFTGEQQWGLKIPVSAHFPRLDLLLSVNLGTKLACSLEHLRKNHMGNDHLPNNSNYINNTSVGNTHVSS